MVLRRIGPLSAMKVAAFVYVGIGFIVGCFIAMISMVGGLADAFNEGINAGLPISGDLTSLSSLEDRGC